MLPFPPFWWADSHIGKPAWNALIGDPHCPYCRHHQRHHAVDNDRRDQKTYIACVECQKPHRQTTYCLIGPLPPVPRPRNTAPAPSQSIRAPVSAPAVPDKPQLSTCPSTTNPTGS